MTRPARTLLGRATGLAITTARTTRAAEALHGAILRSTVGHTPDTRRALQCAANNLRNALGEIDRAIDLINRTISGTATRPTGTASVSDVWVKGAKGVAR